MLKTEKYGSFLKLYDNNSVQHIKYDSLDNLQKKKKKLQSVRKLELIINFNKNTYIYMYKRI